jgi:beta-N-acetylhexosaminidase
MPVDAANGVLLAAIEGTSLTPEEESFFQQEAPAGVTLFSRNLPFVFSATHHLTSYLQSLNTTNLPMIVAIDQEGGRVARLKEPFPNMGPALTVAGGGVAESDLVLLTNYGFTVGAGLRQMGINLNFAPVCDVWTEPKNEAIGDRAFGRRPELVTPRANAFLVGLEASGVCGCLKHFPGQGAAQVDTHEAAAVVGLAQDTLRQQDLPPFKELLRSDRPVMISHAIYPAWDQRPASVSPVIIQELLRGELGFQGLVVSDDFNMRAIPQDDREWQATLVEAMAAGVDLLLVCRGLERCRQALGALRREAQRSPAFARRLEVAAERVASLRARL